MKFLLETDKAYIAAFIDGEGTIGLSRQAGREVGYCPVVRIANTYKDILHWHQEITGYGSLSPQSRGNKKHKAGWIWFLRVEEMREFLIAILPFLRIKDQQARLLLEFLDLPVRLSRYDELSTDTMRTQHVLYSVMADLNKKGPD